MKLKGLPYEVSAAAILQFLSDCAVSGKEEGVKLLIGEDGRPSGEALVILASHEDMVKALNHDRHHLGSRYIEVMFISYEQYEGDIKSQPGAVSLSQLKNSK